MADSSQAFEPPYLTHRFPLLPLEAYFSITFDVKHQHQSFEEIRLQDYNAGRYGRKFSSYATANLSSVNVGGTQPLPSLRSRPHTTLE